MTNLHRATIFLSASFPSGDRGERFRPYDASGIADAVSAFARAILAGNGKLVFGGHPTITPLVLMIARELAISDSVVVFQSAWFRRIRIPEVDEIQSERLGVIRWTDSADDLEESLRIMRNEMIASIPYEAAVFVGGMEGIQDEYDLFAELRPDIPCIPVTGPGGAAAKLPSTGWDILGLTRLHGSRAYPLAALTFVDALADWTERPRKM